MYKGFLFPLLLSGLLASAPGLKASAQVGLPAGLPAAAGPGRSIAQAPPGSYSDVMPVDLAPVRLPERAHPFDTFKTEALYRLPARVFFDATCENTLRLETNVFQTLNRNRPDGIYRVLPNVTLGYALTPNTRVAANYFFLRDTYMEHVSLNRNIHSVGFRVDRDLPINRKTNLTAGFFARELFITKQDELSDLIPSLVLTRRVGQRGVLYGSVLGQVRFRNVLGRYQEFDQFYSIGGVYRKDLWQLNFDTTFITNFGKRAVRQGPNNVNIIMTMEAGRQISRRLPLITFVRVEPIFNIGASQAQGFAGVNVRVFGGVRAYLSKPAIFPVKFNPS